MALILLGSALLVSETLTCSSDDGHRHYCSVAPDYSGVTMLRQRSGSPCEEGRSWGTDSRGLWVDHGCRADFSIDRSNYGINGSPSQTVTCSSDNGSRNYCPIGENFSNVRMVHQRSGSRCEQGFSWGTNEHGLWVDHGCRADFVVERGGSRNNAGYGTINNPNHGAGDYTGREMVVTCSDESGHGHHCDANVVGGVEMVKQHSEAKCVKGYSWGTDERGIWVDHGCRAEFVLHGVPAQ